MKTFHVQTGMDEEVEEGRQAEEERQGDASLKPVAPLNTFQGESILQTAPEDRQDWAGLVFRLLQPEVQALEGPTGTTGSASSDIAEANQQGPGAQIYLLASSTSIKEQRQKCEWAEHADTLGAAVQLCATHSELGNNSFFLLTLWSLCTHKGHLWRCWAFFFSFKGYLNLFFF